MRTRRSARNQDILWRALAAELAGKSEPTPPVVVVPRCWDCLNYPQGPRQRHHGHCTLKGDMVLGWVENRPCFRPRSGHQFQQPAKTGP